MIARPARNGGGACRKQAAPLAAIPSTHLKCVAALAGIWVETQRALGKERTS
eukprot:CAMPEP_0119392030 /NCGR_PEP_ID=MMETSP1334-20130426/119639_1 /TAXON_ID=127549 /ORGANISM="Calcidiscus leptoporus, Strain RCC1130" /LENGTH=51 /DNA_ID=CAMNT_0007414823 /DNA_START=140 /DNA_END=291 /DNA_ORIENTATION=+